MEGVEDTLKELRAFTEYGMALQEKYHREINRSDAITSNILDISEKIRQTINKFESRLHHHEKATTLLEENFRLFEAIRDLRINNDEAYYRQASQQRQRLEASIEEHREKILKIEQDHLKEMEYLQNKYQQDLEEQQNLKKATEDELFYLKAGFNNERLHLEESHADALFKIENDHLEKMAAFNDDQNHQACERDLDELSASWQEALHGLEISIKCLDEEIAEIRSKRKKKHSAESLSKAPASTDPKKTRKNTSTKIEAKTNQLNESEKTIELEEILESTDDISQKAVNPIPGMSSEAGTNEKPQEIFEESKQSSCGAKKRHLFQDDDPNYKQTQEQVSIGESESDMSKYLLDLRNLITRRSRKKANSDM